MITQKLPREKHIREDGWLCELISTKYQDVPIPWGHSYLVSITPGRTRANHFHQKKNEWIAPASGIIEIILEDIQTKTQEKIIVNSKSREYSIIHIPPFIAHSIKNIGNTEACTVVFSPTPEDISDTIKYEVK